MYFCYVVTAWLYLQMQLSDAEDNISIPNPFYTAVSAFNPDTEFCCNGVMGRFDSTPSPRCCGQAAYDYSRQMCCKNELFPVEAGKVCCGNGTIDTASQLCCNALPYPRSSNLVRCCTEGTYDYTTEVCCPGNEPTIVSKDGDSSRSLCCGDKAYNPTTEICWLTSQGQYRVTKKTKPGDQAACGDVTYNYMTHVCCDNKLYNGSYSCCADKEPYLSATQFCCMDYLTQEYEIINKSLGCCGSKSYDKNKQACCKGKVQEIANGRRQECCGVELFDSETEICCYNYLYNPVPIIDNGTSVATTKEKPQSVIRKKSKRDNACCVGISYNDQEQYCCFDGSTGKEYLARKLSPFANLCCGDIVYGVQDGICCGDDKGNRETRARFYKLQPLDHWVVQCCGDQTYNISSSICCGGLVLDTSKGNAACCFDTAYNPNTQFCCMDYTQIPYTKLYYKIDSNPESNQCCGLDLYDINTEMCCSYNVSKLQDGVHCCGDKTYDETKELCCSEIIVTKQNENQNSCCVSFPIIQDDICQSPYSF